MWDLPGPGIEPMSPVLQDEFLTTLPPGSLEQLKKKETTNFNLFLPNACTTGNRRPKLILWAKPCSLEILSNRLLLKVHILLVTHSRHLKVTLLHWGSPTSYKVFVCFVKKKIVKIFFPLLSYILFLQSSIVYQEAIVHLNLCQCS